MLEALSARLCLPLAAVALSWVVIGPCADALFFALNATTEALK